MGNHDAHDQCDHTKQFLLLRNFVRIKLIDNMVQTPPSIIFIHTYQLKHISFFNNIKSENPIKYYVL